MRRLQIAIGSLAIIAILLLPITCICQLMRVDGLYAMPPHLLIFAHQHHQDTTAVVIAPTNDQAATMDMGQILIAGMLDQPAMSAAPMQGLTIFIPAGSTMSQHGGMLTDLNPVLVATMPTPGLLTQALPTAYHLISGNPSSPQYSPTPPTPPPPLVLTQAVRTYAV